MGPFLLSPLFFLLVMKFNPAVSISRRKARKAHFSAPSHQRRILMSAHLSKELRAKHGIRSLPIRKNDEIHVSRGTYKGSDGKVTTVYRRRWVIHIERLNREKSNGSMVNIGLKPSNCTITKLHMDKDRQALINRKAGSGDKESKGKHDADSVMAEQD